MIKKLLYSSRRAIKVFIYLIISSTYKSFGFFFPKFFKGKKVYKNENAVADGIAERIREDPDLQDLLYIISM